MPLEREKKELKPTPQSNKESKKIEKESLRLWEEMREDCLVEFADFKKVPRETMEEALSRLEGHLRNWLSLDPRVDMILKIERNSNSTKKESEKKSQRRRE